jgi:hypothetical protein
MNNHFARLLLVALGLGPLGAGCTLDAETTEGTSESGLTRVTTGSIRVQFSANHGPVAPGSLCYPVGDWTVSVDTGRIVGSGCVDERIVEVDRALSPTELARFVDKVARVQRVTGRPPACNTLRPATVLSVSRSSVARFIGESSACARHAADHRAVTEESVAVVVEELVELTRPARLAGPASTGPEVRGRVR